MPELPRRSRKLDMCPHSFTAALRLQANGALSRSRSQADGCQASEVSGTLQPKLAHELSSGGLLRPRRAIREHVGYHLRHFAGADLGLPAR